MTRADISALANVALPKLRDLFAVGAVVTLLGAGVRGVVRAAGRLVRHG